MNDNDTDGNSTGVRDAAICRRILDDTITGLAVRFGVAPVVAALTDVVGCHSCVTSPLRGAGLRELIERMGRKDPTG
jgi:hypothetical protein